MKNVLILLAAGKSERFRASGTSLPLEATSLKKEYFPLSSGTVLSRALRAFLESESFSEIIVSVPKGGADEARGALLRDGALETLLQGAELTFCEGGETRQESVFKALLSVKEERCVVLIHDGARPFVTKDIIQAVTASALEHGGAAPALETVDTQKALAPDGTIAQHLPRARVVSIQTPQAFLFPEILECHARAREAGLSCTDDTEIWDAFPDVTGGRKVFVTKGDESNKKITYLSDIAAPDADCAPPAFRVGLGTDYHALVKGRKLYAGGVELASERGELAHSDGDALLHAIIDALLGAAALGDIGALFPPDDDTWRDAPSAVLARKAYGAVRAAGWEIENIDCVVELEAPRILPFRERIIASIAAIFGVDPGKIFVKGKTEEGQGEVGAGKAIRAHCVCLLARRAL